MGGAWSASRSDAHDRYAKTLQFDPRCVHTRQLLSAWPARGLQKYPGDKSRAISMEQQAASRKAGRENKAGALFRVRRSFM